MPSKAKPDGGLISLIARHGLESYWSYTHAWAALLEPDGKCSEANPAFEAYKHNHPEANVLGDLLVSDSRKDLDELLRAANLDQKVRRSTFGFIFPERTDQYDCLIVPIQDGRFLFFGEAVPIDPHKMQEMEAELERIRTSLEHKKTELLAVLTQTDEVVHTDPLTFLPNRRLIIADLQKQVTFSDRYNAPLAISMIDLDHFKTVNDTYGHTSGDEVLRFVASELRDHIRQPDEIGRYGGEEFLVILPNSGLKAACEQATRLCQQVRATPIIAGGNVIHMTISIGIAQYRLQKENWQKLLDRADQALYQAKNNGRDRWAVLEA